MVELFKDIILLVIGGVITYITSLLSGKNKTVRGIKKEIIEIQLNKVYTPIMKYKLLCDSKQNFEWINYAYLLFSENYEVIPSHLFNTCKNIYLLNDNKSVNFFYRMIESNYNWCKKSLKYPFDKHRIYKPYLPPYSEIETYSIEFKVAVFFYGYLLLTLVNNSNFPTLLEKIVAPLIVVGLFFAIVFLITWLVFKYKYRYQFDKGLE